MCKRLEKSFNRQKEREKKSFGCLSSGNFHRFVEYLITLLHWLIEAKCSCWESLFLCSLSLCRYNRCLFVLHFYLWILCFSYISTFRSIPIHLSTLPIWFVGLYTYFLLILMHFVFPLLYVHTIAYSHSVMIHSRTDYPPFIPIHTIAPFTQL